MAQPARACGKIFLQQRAHRLRLAVLNFAAQRVRQRDFPFVMNGDFQALAQVRQAVKIPPVLGLEDKNRKMLRRKKPFRRNGIKPEQYLPCAVQGQREIGNQAWQPRACGEHQLRRLVYAAFGLHFTPALRLPPRVHGFAVKKMRAGIFRPVQMRGNALFRK